MKNDKNSIKDELKELKHIEKEMSRLEAKRAKMEARLVKDAGGDKKLLTTKHARRSLGSYALYRFRRRQLMFFVVTTVGVLLFWVGAWEIIENMVSSPWIAVGLGLSIIWITRHYH